MTRVTSHYVEAMRMSRSTFTKGHRQNSLDATNTTPTTAAGWVLLFNAGIMKTAPGGGPAYLPDDPDGDAVTGAIGVVLISEERLRIAKPAFRSLQAEITIMTAASVLE